MELMSRNGAIYTGTLSGQQADRQVAIVLAAPSAPATGNPHRSLSLLGVG